MRNRFLKISVLWFLVSGFWFFAPLVQAADKPTITVYGFDVKASSSWLHSAEWDIGSGMGEMLIDALVATGKFNVVERLNIGDITFEQDLMTQGRTAKGTGAQTGKLKGAQYIVRGAITEFDYSESGGDLGVRIKGFNLGLAQSNAHIGGILRIFDAATGEIYASQRFSRSIPATGIDFGYNKGKYGINLGSFKKTPLGEATHYAIQDITEYIVNKIPAEAPGSKWTCSQCGTSNSASSEFCSKCGAPRQDELTKCPYCGAEVSPGMKFCTSCGKSLVAATCPKCHRTLKPGTKFCPDDGTKIE